MSAKVSIIILNWNGRKYLEQFLPSVVKSSYLNKEIIVADNASTDDSIIFLKANYPGVIIISLQKNHGFAQGYNEALKQVQCDYYILLNSDVEVTENWIEPIIELMENDKTIAACQPKILSYNNKKMFEYAGAAGGWIDFLGYPFARGRVVDVCEKDTHQYDTEEAIFWASGAALFVRANAFHEVNGFDNYFFAHMEEIDLCWRLQLAGYNMYACPKSVVYHVGGGTLAKGDPRKVFLNFRNNLIMLAKNLPAMQSIWKIPFRFLLDILSAFKSLLSGDRAYFIAVIKAQLSFIKWSFFKKKCSVFPKTKKGKLNGWYNKSVVWKYFVSGKKTFAQIVQNKS
ncbi:MAG TPA: glycosyltransferase family 2 protein [Puia sp.]|nr:glycosyltransferase family 2 protein [Puia sp.]